LVFFVNYSIGYFVIYNWLLFKKIIFKVPKIIGEGNFSVNFNEMMKLMGVLWTIGGVLAYVYNLVLFGLGMFVMASFI